MLAAASSLLHAPCCVLLMHALQVSLRNRVLILFDWMKAKVFGRDISLF